MKKPFHDGWRKHLAVLAITHTLKRNIIALHVRGDLKRLGLANDIPTVYLANHISIWDGLAATYLTYTHLQQDPFIMTAQHAMLPISSWAGAFSVDMLDSYRAAQSWRYANSLLKEAPRCGLWMFAQGHMAPFHACPLSVRSGTPTLVKQHPNLRVIPVAFYHSSHRLHIESFIDIGEPMPPLHHLPKPQIQQELAKSLNSLVDRFSQDLISRNLDEFVTVLKGRRDISYYLYRMFGMPPPPFKSWDRWWVVPHNQGNS